MKLDQLTHSPDESDTIDSHPETPRYSDRPSYLPEYVPDRDIPVSLKEETVFWTTGEGQILSEEATLALMEAEALQTELAKSDTLKSAGLNPHALGTQSLKGHATRVAVLSLLINDGLRHFFSPAAADTRLLALAALLHDVGKLDPEVNKVVMSDKKFAKNSPEWRIMARHPKIGAEFALSMPGLNCGVERLRVADTIYEHHERYDGSGYYNIPSSRISPEAAIIGVADTIDAMGERRSYKGPIATTGVMHELERCKEQFDGDVLEVIRKMRNMSGVFVRHRSDRP